MSKIVTTSKRTMVPFSSTIYEYETFVVTTEGNFFAIGGVLSQWSIESDLPIAFATRTLSLQDRGFSKPV